MWTDDSGSGEWGVSEGLGTSVDRAGDRRRHHQIHQIRKRREKKKRKKAAAGRFDTLPFG
jgi:hypothetical protein